MSKSRTLVCLLWSVFVLTSLSYGATADRIVGDLNSGQKVQLYSGKSLLRQGPDIGRVDGTRTIEGVSLNFKLSASQQADLDQFLAQLGNPRSPNYHKYLTIPQYAKRFGMSQNDLNKVVAWLQSQGLTNIKVAPTHNKVSFDATVAQIESLFSIEMHHYLVDGVVHLANATNPSVPVAMASSVMHVGHLNDFAPKPRVNVRPNFTSYVSGSHFLSPGDFATIYDLNSLYSAGATGSNQKIAIVGQSTISQTDINNFRSAAGLTASTVTMTLIEGTAARCAGDETESDLDVEWSGGVAKGAQIIFLYAGLGPGDTCTNNRVDNVWDALEEALTGSLTTTSGSPVAPFVSTSYGFCEQGLQEGDPGFVTEIQGWVQTGQTLGVSLTSASGDAGAADCDTTDPAIDGLAVDVPAAIPEVTGAGGNEFTGDAAATVTGTAPNTTAGATQYWSASGTGSDEISTALSYIPEEAWNDTTAADALSASGGGVSTIFPVPSWQNVTGVPSGTTMRLVPDISVSASPNHDGYLICTEDTSLVTTGQCTTGFRDGTGGNLGVIGGTSAAAPTFTAILALINQYLEAAPGLGLAPVNPALYGFATTNSTVFHDITTGNNIVPCAEGSTGCPTTAPFQYGFSAGTGYDAVTGLGSVDGYELARVWFATIPTFSMAAGAFNPTSIPAGASAVATITLTPQNSYNETVNLSCSGLPAGATCSFSPASISGGSGTSQLTLQTLPSVPASTLSVAVNGTGKTRATQTVANLAVTATTATFSLNASISGGTLSVSQGQTTGAVNMTVTSTSNPSFVVSNGSGGTVTSLPVTYTCTGLPSEATCAFTAAGANSSQQITSSATSVTLTIQTTAPTTKLERPLDREPKIFYAVLLPGLLGIFVIGGSRKRLAGGVRVLGLILVLGASTMWLASCGGSSTSNNKNPGTPVGSTSITVNATTSGGPSSTLQFTLTVTAVAK